MVNQESDQDSCPEEHRDEGSLFNSLLFTPAGSDKN
jgi:hypothetical protein